MVNEHGSSVKKFFWLGPDPTKATLKLAIIEDFTAAVQSAGSAKLIWTDEMLARLNERLAQIDAATPAVPTVVPNTP